VKDQAVLSILIKKYFNNDCTPDEIRQLFELIREDQHGDFLRKLVADEMSDNAGRVVDYESEQAAIEKIKTRLLAKLSAESHRDKKNNDKIRPLVRPSSFVAALWALFAALLGLLLYQYGHHRRQVAFQTLVTPKGKSRFVQLYDGTKIWLCPSSTLQYPNRLTGKNREVTLNGEAFFEVAKDKTHPFIIHSGPMQTRVVGTSFDVKSYRGSDQYCVTVVSGIVRVALPAGSSNKMTAVVLKPNQQTTFDTRANCLTAAKAANTKPILNRRQGILTYEGLPVAEVIADLVRYYNVSITIQNKQAGCLCYGQFDSSRPVDITLRQVAASIGAMVEQRKDGYVLKGGCDE